MFFAPYADVTGHSHYPNMSFMNCDFEITDFNVFNSSQLKNNIIEAWTEKLVVACSEVIEVATHVGHNLWMTTQRYSLMFMRIGRK